MKKLIAILLALVLALSLTVPASAATTLHWDWGKAQTSIGNAAAQIVQEQQTEPAETTEPVLTEYIVVEETEAEVYTENEPEPAGEVKQDRLQRWRDWLRRWSWCLEGWK